MPRYKINYVLEGSIEVEMDYQPETKPKDWGEFDLESYPHLKIWANSVLETTPKELLLNGIEPEKATLHNIDLDNRTFSIINPEHDWLRG